jgi:hypothetical protein
MASVAGPRPACVSTYPVPCPGPSSGSGCPAVRCAARPVSGHLGSSSGSGCPAIWCPPVQRPAVWCPPIQRPALWCPPSSVRTRPSPPTSGGGVGDQMGAAGQPAPRERVEVPVATAPSSGSVNGRGLDDAGDATEVARWSVECRRRTRPGWVRAVAAARARCPARQARPASERPWLAAARWARSRLQREVAAPAAWLACWGWVGDHGAWLSWNLPPGWTGPGRADGLAGGNGRAAPARPRLAASIRGLLPTAL